MTETTARLFEWLISYHIERDLPKCLPHIRDGIFYQQGRPLREGQENEQYPGVLVIVNGDTLLQRLKDQRIIGDTEHDEPVRIASQQDLFDYLDGQDNNDGAYVFDGVHSTLTRVYELYNGVGRDLQSLVSRVPEDFVDIAGGLPVQRYLGTKTRLAIRMPHQFQDVEALQIKRSAYTDLGMGKVTRFTKDGLAEEFFFDVDPQSVGPFVEPTHGIVGVRRTYEMQDGQVVRTGESVYVPRRARELPAIVSSESYRAAVA